LKPTEPPILAQPPSPPPPGRRWTAISFAPSSRQWLAIVVLSLTGAAAFGLAPDTALETIPTRVVERPLPLPGLAGNEREAAAGATYWREERVQRGDTIGSLLARAGHADGYLDVLPAERGQRLRLSREAPTCFVCRPGE
jgi:hypothetical protein